MVKGQTSSLYTLLGVILVSVFVLFLFTTQAGNQAENLRTVSSADVSFTNQLELKGLYKKDVPAPGGQVKMINIIKYGCVYGDQNENYRIDISNGDEDIIAEAPKILERHLDDNIGAQYRMTVGCNSDDKKMVAGSKIPEDTERVISSTIEVPLTNGNKTQVILKRW